MILPRPLYRLQMSLIATTAMLIALAPAAVAYAGSDTPAAAKDASPQDESLKEAVLQSDGITNRVVDKLWADTDSYWHHGDYQRIVSLLRVCVATDPSFTEAYSDGAWLLWSMGDTPGADALLEDGERRSPARADIYSEIGLQFYITKRFPQAEKYLQRAVETGTDEVTSYTTYAHSLQKVGRIDDSVKVWQTIVKKFPKFVAGPRNLAEMTALRDAAADRHASSPDKTTKAP